MALVTIRAKKEKAHQLSSLISSRGVILRMHSVLGSQPSQGLPTAPRMKQELTLKYMCRLSPCPVDFWHPATHQEHQLRAH
jgi:hypothetical protein